MSCPFGTSPGLATRYPHPTATPAVSRDNKRTRRRGDAEIPFFWNNRIPPRLRASAPPRLRVDPLVLGSGDDEVDEAFGDDHDLLDGLAVDPAADLGVQSGGGADLVLGRGGGDQHLAAQLAVHLDGDVDRLLGDELQVRHGPGA